MRQIKFRAWDSELGFFTSQLGYFVEFDGSAWFNLGTAAGGISDNLVDQTAKLILEEFTGLHDKNGKEIYEGDIVKTVSLANDHHQLGATDVVFVRYFMGNACLCFGDNETGVPIYPFNVTSSIEVIGNIHENPELLEAVK